MKETEHSMGKQPGLPARSTSSLLGLATFALPCVQKPGDDPILGRGGLRMVPLSCFTWARRALCGFWKLPYGCSDPSLSLGILPLGHPGLQKTEEVLYLLAHSC